MSTQDRYEDLSSGWIDISVSLTAGMAHWPGDPEISIYRISDIEQGDEANLTKLEMAAHTGTHMDAPLHFVQDGRGMDEMPFSATIGTARVIEIRDPESIKKRDLETLKITVGERILFKTVNSEREWEKEPFREEFVHLTTEAAEFLAERHVQTVGIDYLSVSGYNKNETQVHRALLEAGIWIIEGLTLRNVNPGNYELICLPLKIDRSDGAPARAIIRPLK